MQMTRGHAARLSLACLATLGDTPNTLSRATSLLVDNVSARHCIRRVSRRDKKCFCFLLGIICVSLTTNFVAGYKVSKLVKLGNIEGTCPADNVPWLFVHHLVGPDFPRNLQMNEIFIDFTSMKITKISELFHHQELLAS